MKYFRYRLILPKIESMKKNYFILLCLFLTAATYAQEVLSISGYNGAGSTITATTSTINDEITIRFEDSDIINNFYTENQTFIHTYLGLETSSGSFQAVPGTFNDLSWQPVLNLTDGDASTATNTYEITFTPGQLFPSLENETIFGINFLFQNQFGGGGNNQTVDFFIDLVDATLNSSTLSVNDTTKTQIQTSYNGGRLEISGINTTSNISIYNLLGRQVVDLKNVAINGTFSKYLDLPRNNIYIVKISAANFSKTFKIVAK
ncbi:putative secreted protein (Por secretion system target) [Kordia periserrulae]|uniref:Putative secreted protein (Por secretion system target) n=2 Tax=Kordia periserrulae TaxID=701523 RepID=A0A2T6C472_9FLAO|nr:putative secreted protein (Por secretion system target) [Kordia periserrulae]